MALQIVTGDLSVNKKAPLIQELFKIKAQDPQAIIYYLVPEHIKFDMENLCTKRKSKNERTSRIGHDGHSSGQLYTFGLVYVR
ncbi:hypothetical protein [Globicatella sp. PHS-GS-PNBC-21-1553]|uniref:hypothetical protein n=1 Tax=Globicatella sp. PHS-GS-PNBC-21-1553 TaxID=2885764 RepID=UPI00298F26AB|nr:hypothetical protein [Globicatella sp. PHS-GS-PNBC-21-1553]WPC08531.1 hypothetical protein LB888_11135 [Globicatella sp. PHS-GS-PNBC-21-1553]